MLFRLLETGKLPDDFNEAFMVFLPKVSPPPGEDTAECKPSETRPLSLSNTDSKILAKALARPLEIIGTTYVVEAQQGNVKGRDILSNVVQVETKAIECLVSSKNAAMIFLDFAAAFPSIAHVFYFVHYAL